MKHLKMLGLLTLAVAAFPTFASPASGTILTSPAGTTYTSTISAQVIIGGTRFEGFFTTVECKKSTLSGKVETHGSTTTAGGKLSTLTFTECNFPVTVRKAGSLEFHTMFSSATGDGLVTSSGAEIEISTSVGTCIFTTSSTSLGWLTPGNLPALDVEGPAIPRTGGSAGFLCGSWGYWRGTYNVTTPSALLVD